MNDANQSNKRLNFWLGRPPFAIVGFLKPLKRILGDRLAIYVKKESTSNRSGLDSCVISELKCQYVASSDIDSIDVSNSINIVNGFNSFFLPFLIKKRGSACFDLGCFTELPCPMGHFKPLKQWLLNFKYRRAIKKSSNYFDFILPIGTHAEEYFKRIGWKKCIKSMPYITDFDSESTLKIQKNNEETVFCYIGRNDFCNKGLDLAINGIKKQDKAKLVIIGQYGPDKEKVSRIARANNRIIHLSSVEPENIVECLKQYNVNCLIVPSKIDGWNPNVYMAVILGIPCLASRKAGSHTLIEEIDNNLVFKPKQLSLKKTISYFINMDNNEINALKTKILLEREKMMPTQLVKDVILYLEQHFDL